MSVFKPEPVCRDFMQSEAYVSVLAGPIGSSKSVTAAHKLLQIAAGQAPNAKGLRKTRMIITRNTADQLALTTRKTVFDWLPPGQAGVWKSTEKTYVIEARLADGTALQSEWIFIALDTPDDVRKALSLEATALWGNEARELHGDVVDGLLGRINRYPSMREGGATRACAIFDTNMPDEDTWWQQKMEAPPANWKIFVQPPAILPLKEYTARHGDQPTVVTTNANKLIVIDPAAPIVDKDGNPWVLNPQAENLRNLAPDYYPNLVPGKTDDWLRVYLRCQYGRSLSGRPVYEKSFTPDFHIAKTRLIPILNGSYPIGIGMDFGRSPAAVFKQRDPRGRILTLGEATSENMGLDVFIRTQLKPYIARRFQGASFYVAPDPAGYAKQQQYEHSLVDQLKAAGFACVPQHLLTNDPEKRIGAVERLLSQQVGGQAMYLVDPVECPMIVKGFKFGYRYRINKNGSVEATPDKNEYSHPHDANQYIDTVVEGNIRGVQLNQQARVPEKVRFAT